jgi:phosphotriesterase-related protein
MEPVIVRNSILTHEHVLVDFIGADQASPSRYNADEVFAAARPKLEAARKYGCRRLLECTPAFLGRDPRLLARLQEATGVELWTNTGLYAAANHKFLPAFAKTESPLALAKRWIAEWRNGVDGAKPRFIKIGVNNAPLHELDRKVVEAGAIASLETGLTIACHTSGGGPAAEATMEILAARKVPLHKYVWVHAQNEKSNQYFESAARAGAWVSFDGLSEKSDGRHWQAYFWMLNAGLLQRMLLSHDSGWYRVGEPGGGRFNGYTYVYEKFLPRVPAEFRELLMVTNPVKAFGD